jgi:hypothetical protein
VTVSPEHNHDDVRLTLLEANDKVCSGQVPLLLGIQPALGLIDGNETVQLHGWGFTPSDEVLFAGKVASTTYVSPVLLEALTPSRVAIGLTEVKVRSKTGASHSRRDLFRYYADTIDLGPISFNPNQNAKDISDLIVGDFFPKDRTVAASSAWTFRSLDSLGLTFAIPAQPLPMIGSTAVSFVPGSAPSSVAAADMNADGIPDFIVALSGMDQVQVFINDGLGNLTGQPAIGVGKQPEGVAVKDLNGDGKPDIVTADFAGNSLSVLLSLPKGGFLPALSLKTTGPAATQNPVSVVISDINQDGWNDLAAVNQSGGNINLFLGFGSGAFVPNPVQQLVGSNPTQIAAVDTNRDGVDDLLVTNRMSNNVQVLVNRTKKEGSLNFDTFTLTTDPSPESMAFADMNGDGINDLIVPCSATNTINVFINKPPDGLKGASPRKFRMPGPPICDGVRRVAAGDLIMDGQLDLVGFCRTGGAIMKNQTL